MPEELAKLRGAGGSPAQAAAKRSRCRSFSGSPRPRTQRDGSSRSAVRCRPAARGPAAAPPSSRCIEPEPRHAGIDMQDGRQRALQAGAPRRSRHRSRRASRAPARYRAQDSRLRCPAIRPPSTASIASGTSCTDLQRLVQQCDEEVPAAGRVQRLRDGTRAKTVAVGLDHAGDRAGRMHRAQQPPVGDDGSEIDFENRAGAVSRRHDPNARGRGRRSG